MANNVIRVSLMKKIKFSSYKTLQTFTVFPRMIAGGDYIFFRSKRGRSFEERRLFEGGNYFKFLLTGSRVLNILFYFPIK